MPPQTKSIEDIYKQFELDMLYAGKSSGDSEGIIRAMQGQRELASMPQSGAIESLTPIGPIDLAAETAMTGASQMENMNPLAMLLAGALAPGAYKKIKTANTPALLKKFDIKVDNPLYHNTTVNNAESILRKNRIAAGEFSKSPSVSTTRDPEYSLIPGLGSSDLDVQLVLDKKGISNVRGTKVKPYVYSPRGSARKTELGSPIFGKPTPWFEAEERVYSNIGIPTGHIKAIKLRGLPKGVSANDDLVLSLIKKSTSKKIPLIVEPASEDRVMGLLDILDPNQKSKALKNIKFTRSGASDTRFKKLSGDNNEYEAIIDGKKYNIYKEQGEFYADGVGFLGKDFDEVTDFIKSGEFDDAIEYNRM